MDTIWTWFLLSNVALACLWIFYRALLHADTFFTAKRFTLLFGILFALAYPLLDIAGWYNSLHPGQVLIKTFQVTLPEVIVQSESGVSSGSMQGLILGYVGIAALMLGRVIVQMLQVSWLAWKCPTTQMDGQKIICLPKGAAPFSFFGMIFIHPNEHSQSDLKEIIQHEQTHVRQGHTLDVLLAELLCSTFWINPFAWLLKYHLRENLEFLADKDVVHAGFDPKSYQYHLLRLSYQSSPIRMGNNFNVSQLQNRIKMMNKKRTSQVGWSKYLFALPLFAALLLVSNACKNQTDKDANKKTTVESIQSDRVMGVDTAASVPPPPPPLRSTVKFTAPKEDKAVKRTVKFTPPVIVSNQDSAQSMAEQMPEFPGGNDRLVTFIKEHMTYPAAAAENGVEGKVFVRFIVSRTGTIKDVVVLRGLSKECDDEAIRVVKMMPNWKPGMDKGKLVEVYYTLPFMFKLQK